MMEKTENISFTIPLGTKAHEVARQSRQAICNPHQDTDKAQQVYINSLVVYAVDYYLKILGFETEFEQSSSQDNLMLKFLTGADLPVKNIGLLECLPVLSNTESYEILPEVWSDRIGYIFVRLNETQTEAVILGFIKNPVSKVSLNEFQSVDQLIDYLTDKKEAATINT